MARNPLSPLRFKTINDENLPPALGSQQPLTPMQTALNNIRKRLERQMATDIPTETPESRVSPGLAQLRNTPGSRLKDKQKVLARKHQEAKSKLDNVNVGGGISLWPEMENMRLTKQEVINLFALCFLLIILTFLLFKWLHGDLLTRLNFYGQRLLTFANDHPILLDSQSAFDHSVLIWHNKYKKLQAQIKSEFYIQLDEAPLSYKLCVICYIFGITTLLFYLIDNMFAQTKLTPRRIKNWVSLLVIISSWTFYMIILLITALKLEKQVEGNVHRLSEVQGDMAATELTTKKYNQVLAFWRVKALPPTSTGTLHIMGLLAVQDVFYYIQYYSVPVFTALVTPVIKLLVSLKEIYSS